MELVQQILRKADFEKQSWDCFQKHEKDAHFKFFPKIFESTSQVQITDYSYKMFQASLK